MKSNRIYLLGSLLLVLFLSCKKESNPKPNATTTTTGIDSTAKLDTTLRNTWRMDGGHHWIGRADAYDWTPGGGDTTYYLSFDKNITVINDSTIFFDQASYYIKTLHALSWDTMAKRIVYTAQYVWPSYEYYFDTLIYHYGSDSIIYSEVFNYYGHVEITHLHSP